MFWRKDSWSEEAMVTTGEVVKRKKNMSTSRHIRDIKKKKKKIRMNRIKSYRPKISAYFILYTLLEAVIYNCVFNNNCVFRQLVCITWYPFPTDKAMLLVTRAASPLSWSKRHLRTSPSLSVFVIRLSSTRSTCEFISQPNQSRSSEKEE